MKEIDKLLKQRLEWEPTPETVRDYHNNVYNKEECSLRINDFPEEPLWTLTYLGESIDFDDLPKQWKIKYRTQR